MRAWAAALITALAVPSGVPASETRAAARFHSNRITVTTVGRGSDVILIPGPSSSPDRAWRSTADAVPGPDATAESVRPAAERIRAGRSAAPSPQGDAMLAQTVNGMVDTRPARSAILADARASDRQTTANAYYELLTTDLRPELERISVPLTVLYARNAALPMTDAQLAANYRQLYDRAAGARLVYVPNSAHFIPIDAPDRFRAELRAFLR